MSVIELMTDPPAAATRAAKSAGTLPFSRKTCCPAVGTAMRDIAGENFRTVGALVTASLQDATTTAIDKVAPSRLSA
jgi:hypothetical protein